MSKVKIKALPILCTYSALVELDDLGSMQSDLKDVSDTNMEKIKKSLRNNGFLFPMWVWKDAKGSHFIIDGVTRLRALLALRKDGLEIGKVPVVYVEAKSKVSARRLVLFASSEYARLDREGAYDLLESIDWSKFYDEVNLGTLKPVDVKSIKELPDRKPKIVKTRRKEDFIFSFEFANVKQQKHFMKLLEWLKFRGEILEDVVFGLVKDSADAV